LLLPRVPAPDRLPSGDRKIANAHSVKVQTMMVVDPVELDEHRGLAAQKYAGMKNSSAIPSRLRAATVSTETRRRLHEVQADQVALRIDGRRE